MCFIYPWKGGDCNIDRCNWARRLESTHHYCFSFLRMSVLEWLVTSLVDWLVSWSFHLVVGWLVGGLVHRFGWSVDLVWIGCVDERLVGWLDFWFVGWLVG